MKPIIEIIDVSKTFRINHENQPYLSLRDSITGLFKFKKTSSEEFYALRNINLSVNPGDSVGIVGKNGAGKSTLLKILSKITPPTSGKIICRGRIASLLEVGTGFHPELTGKENIFLNGSILGMRKKEIMKNFDAIVDFAGVEKFIDTPLKHYSSGMQLRLAFAVAAFLENEILVIDEVLAVGDGEFQKKCLRKMEDVSKNQGRTILFVSHQLGSISNFCQKGVLLQEGKIMQEGSMSNIIDSYTKLLNQTSSQYKSNSDTKDIYIETCNISKENSLNSNEFLSTDDARVEIKLARKSEAFNPFLSFTIQSRTGDFVSTFVRPVENLIEVNSSKKLNITFKCDRIAPNDYFLRLALFEPTSMHVYDLQEMICPFKIIDSGSEMARFEGINYGYFNLDYKIEVE
jgi:lipopolysaccharide transport system ATP-binding protein